MPVLVPTAGAQLAVNGVDLSAYATVTFSKAPLMSAPKRRGDNVVVPGRHGAVRTPRKRYEQADLTLQLYVLGALPDGTVPPGGDAAELLYANADALMQVFGAETVLLTRTMPDGSQREAVAEVADKIDWTRQLGSAPLVAQVSVALVLPGAFWYDHDAVSHSFSGTTGTTSTLTEFAGATAPIAGVAVTFGPCNNPQLAHGQAYVAYSGVISSGRQLVINTGNWSVSTGTGSAWSPDMRLVSFSPGPTWLELDPTLDPFQVTLTHTGGGTASCSISGRRAYLTA